MRHVLAWTVVGLVSLGAGAATVGAAAAPDADLVAAQAAAQRILAVTPLPSGATTQPADPSVGGSLSQTYVAIGAWQVHRSQYWTVGQTQASVSAYMSAHLPAGSKLVSQQGLGAGWSWQERSFPAVTGRVTSELMEVGLAPARGGGTAIRVDALVLWRPTWDQIPTGSRGAEVRLNGARQRTVTGAALARLRAFVDAAPVVAPGVYSCPAGFAGQAIAISFVDARGRQLARAGTNSASGCRWLGLSVAGRRGPALIGGWNIAPRLWSDGSLIHCTARQLRVSVSAPAVAPAQDSATITVRNVARTPCSLRGAPTVELRTAAGRRLPVGQTHESGPGPVATAPARGTLSSSLGWSASRRCALPPPAVALIGVPGITARIAVALRPSRHRLGPCAGRVETSTLVDLG